MARTLVLDNGAYFAKISYNDDQKPRLIPNCVIKAKTVRNRVFVGDQIDECRDLSGLFYLLPFQKGFLVNWDIERQVWDHMFGKNGLNVNTDETGIILTEPHFNFTSIQEAMNEVLFEDYQFQFALRCNAGYLSQYRYCRETPSLPICCLVVDSGYSFTHIIPYCNGSIVKKAIRRISVGGKILTNHLKDIISYRQLMVMDETHVVNQMKEDTCFVSTDFHRDMETSRKKGNENSIVQDYVLPDYTHIKRGFVRNKDQPLDKVDSSEQVIRMNIERFSIPELLFHPSDVGIHEMGIPEAIVHSVNATAPEMRPHFYSNILLTGGNCLFSGFKQRLYTDLRSLVPDEFNVNICLPDDPLTFAWAGGCVISRDEQFTDIIVTKQLYEEYGPNICQQTFDV